MRVARMALPLALLLLLVGQPAAAQDAGQVGVTAGYPSVVGLVWHATDRVAFRAELSDFRTGSTESSTSSVGNSSKSDNWTVGFAVSGLFYVARWDTLRVYASPRLAIARSSITSRAVGFDALDSESTGTAYSLSGSLGAQYTPVRRLSFYAEAGLAVDTRHNESAVTHFETDSNSVGLRTAWGVVFYF